MGGIRHFEWFLDWEVQESGRELASTITGYCIPLSSSIINIIDLNNPLIVEELSTYQEGSAISLFLCVGNLESVVLGVICRLFEWNPNTFAFFILVEPSNPTILFQFRYYIECENDDRPSDTWSEGEVPHSPERSCTNSTAVGRCDSTASVNFSKLFLSSADQEERLCLTNLIIVFTKDSIWPYEFEY